MYDHPFVLLNSWTLRYDCPFVLLKCVFPDTLMTLLPWDVFLPLSTPQTVLSPEYPTLLSSYLDSWFLSTLTLPHKRDLKNNKTKQNPVRGSSLKPWLLGEAAGCGTVLFLRSKSLPHFFLVFLPSIQSSLIQSQDAVSLWVHHATGLWMISTCCFSLGDCSSSKLTDSTPD